MLCTIAIRRTKVFEGADAFKEVRFSLRITGKTALGPSGTGGSETREDLSAGEVLATLERLHLDEVVLQTARIVMNAPTYSRQFVPVAEDVQISFEVLERADVSSSTSRTDSVHRTMLLVASDEADVSQASFPIYGEDLVL